MTKREQKALAFLKERFGRGQWFKDHPADHAYRWEHSIRVAGICRDIARAEGMDSEAAWIAGLLHDVAYGEDFPEGYQWTDHGRDGARIAGPFLESLGMAREVVDDICFAIAIHVDDEAGFEGRRTPFTETVGDADNIDRFDVYRIYETLQYQKFSELPLSEKRETASTMLRRLTELREMKLGSATANSLWQQRLGYYIGFYEKLVAQLQYSSQIL